MSKPALWGKFGILNKGYSHEMISYIASISTQMLSNIGFKMQKMVNFGTK